MSADTCAAKNELTAIFPQHNEETITRIYNNVVRNSGEDVYNVLPICIDQLLELPAANIVVPSEGNNGDNTKSTKSYQRNLFVGDKGRKTPDGNNKLWKDISEFDDSKSSSSSNEQNIRDYKFSTSSNYSDVSYFAEEGESISKEKNSIEKLQYKSLSSENDTNDSPLPGDKRKLIDVNSNKNTSSRIKRCSDKQKYIKRDLLPNDTSSCNDSTVSKDHDLSTISKRVVPIHTSACNDSTTVSEDCDLPLSTLTKGMDGYLEIGMKIIKAIINNVDDAFLEKLISEQTELLPIPEVVNSVVEYLLEHEDYPKVDQSQPSSSSHSTATITSSTGTSKYNEQSLILLQNGFPKIATSSIKKVFYMTNNYTKAYNELNNVLKQIISGEKNVEDTTIKSFLKGKRCKININDLNSTLTEEIRMAEESKMVGGVCDIVTTVDCNNDEGQTIECGCCYNEVVFEDMVQCVEGHLFCITCLQNYSKEAIYGTGKVELFCMTNGCNNKFPVGQLKKALVGNLMEKYMERVQNEDLKLANLDNLIKCPGCEFAAEMDDGGKVFHCQNPSCMRESCRYCKEDWKDHVGISCKEVEKKDITNLRTTYEEKMTQAKVRKCWQCSTIFLKSDGCNKMTCRCSAKMCYICRKEKIDYKHFCEHPRNPGEACKMCSKCSLWTDPSEDDDRAVAEIKKQAEEERMKLGGDKQTSKISIGPSPSKIKSDKCNQKDSDNYDEYYGSSGDDSDDSSSSILSSVVNSDSSRDFSGYDSMEFPLGGINFHCGFDRDIDDCMEIDSSSDSDSDIF